MADVSLSFGTPGVQAAIQQAGRLKREVRAIGAEEIKVQQVRKKSTAEAVQQEGVVRRAINRTSAAITKQIAVWRARRAEAVAAGGGINGPAVGRALGRIGGTVGARINAGAEGLNLGGALGKVAIGAVALGLALTSLSAASERASASAAKVAQSNQQIVDTARGIIASNQGRALGFGQSAIQPFREIVSRLGRQGGVAEVERLRGLGIGDADRQILAAIKSGAIEKLGVKSVGQIIETGSRIGIQADFAKLSGLGPRALERLKNTGSISDLVFGTNTRRAELNQEAFNRDDPLARRFNEVQTRQGQINTEIFRDFLGGAANVALGKQLTELRNAEAVAIGRVTEALTKESEVAEARADAEFELIRRIKETASVIGLSEGSEAQKLQRINDERASIGAR